MENNTNKKIKIKNLRKTKEIIKKISWKKQPKRIFNSKTNIKFKNDII